MGTIWTLQWEELVLRHVTAGDTHRSTDLRPKLEQFAAGNGHRSLKYERCSWQHDLHIVCCVCWQLNVRWRLENLSKFPCSLAATGLELLQLCVHVSMVPNNESFLGFVGVINRCLPHDLWNVKVLAIAMELQRRVCVGPVFHYT